MPLDKPSETRAKLSSGRLTAFRTALAAAVFLAVVLLILLANFHDMRKSDPLSSASSRKLNELVAKHRMDTANEGIKKEVQTLDQRIRQNYFDSLAKSKTGAYLLLAGFAVLVFSLQKAYVPSISPGSGKRDGRLGYTRMLLAAIAVILIIFSVLTSFKG